MASHHLEQLELSLFSEKPYTVRTIRPGKWEIEAKPVLPPSPVPDEMSVPEAAKWLGLDRRTVLRHIEAGTLYRLDENGHKHPPRRKTPNALSPFVIAKKDLLRFRNAAVVGSN